MTNIVIEEVGSSSICLFRNHYTETQDAIDWAKAEGYTQRGLYKSNLRIFKVSKLPHMSASMHIMKYDLKGAQEIAWHRR